MLGTLGLSIFNGKVYVDGTQYKHLYIFYGFIFYIAKMSFCIISLDTILF